MSESLIDLPYFHGAIDTRECRELLPEVGDFLIRHYNNEKDKSNTANSIYALTVAVTPDLASTRSKNLPDDYSLKQNCITRLKSFGITGSNDSYTFQGSTTQFPSVQALCESFINSRKPLPTGIVIAKPINRKPWQLMLSSIQFPDPEIVLGKGAYGKVIKAKLLKDGGSIDVAVKSATNESSSEILSDIYTEARAMRQLSHPNIIRLEGVVVEKLPILLVIEFMEGSCLLSALQKKKVSNTMRFPIVVGILYGLLYMHTHDWIHRDIAARNIMVSHDCRIVKIIDFGLAKHGTMFRLGVCQKIPTKWLAPEVRKTWNFSTKSDTWAFGVTIWEVFHDGADPPKEALIQPISTSTTKLAKSQNTITKARKAHTKRSKDGGRSGAGGAQVIKITENLDYLPKLFLPLYEQMFIIHIRERIELAAIADDVEKKILPTLPKLVADEVRIHVERRPPFDPKFRAPCNTASSVSEMNEKKTSIKPTGLNATIKRKDKKKLEETSSKGTPSAPAAPVEKPEKVEKKGETTRRKKR